MIAQPLLTVEEAVGTALKNNYDILLAKSDSAAFAIDKSYANAAFLPRINATSGLVFNNNNQRQKLPDGTIRSNSSIRSDNINAAVLLNWTVFDGFKVFATRDKLNALVQLGEWNVKAQAANTTAAVITNYYNIVRQQQQLKAIEELMSINEERVKLADKKLSTGLGAKPELLQAKTDLNAQKAVRLQQQLLIEQLKEQLNQLMAAPLNTQYKVADSIPVNNNIILGDVLQQAEAANPALMAAKQNITVADFILKERRADRYPVININGAYNFGKTNNQTVLNNFTPLLNQTLGFNYGLSASIPIFNNYNTKRLIQQAQRDIDYNKTVFENIRSRNAAAVSNAFKEYDVQNKILLLEEENILLAKENTAISLERFRLGAATYLELRETQKTLEDAYNRLIAARYNTKAAETELLRLNGTLIK